MKDFLEKILEDSKHIADNATLVDKIDHLLLPLIDILKNNQLYLKSLSLVKGVSKNGRHGRNLGKWMVVESEAMVKLYTTFIFKGLNDALRNGKKLNKEFDAMRRILDDALERLPSYNKGVLHRSVYLSEQEIKKLFKKGKDFTEKGFLSTTHSEKALLSWMEKNPSHNVIFIVYGKNGKLIEKAAYMAEEAEVLFKSGTTFVVEKISKIRKPGNSTKEMIEIILKEK